MIKLTIENDTSNIKYAVETWVRDAQIAYSSNKIKARLIPNENRIEEPIAVVGYGPSLKYTWEKIKEFKIIITSSGAHKFLIDRGIIPTYHVEVDPRKHKIKLLGQPHKGVEYLIASTCHPEYIDLLADYNIKLWHIFDATDAGINMLPADEWGITGGSDAGMRSITIAALLGYRNMHVFGIDGCFEGDDRHAAEHPNNKLPKCEFEWEDKTYYTTPPMLESAKNVVKELKMLPAVNATFYGEGLVQELVKTYDPEIHEKIQKYQNVIALQKPRMITDEYAKLNWQLHQDNPIYGIGGGKYADTVLKLCEGLNTRLVLDYGCGKGYLGKSLPFPIWEYDPGIPGKADGARPADIVVCTDVLEHIEPELLPEVLADIRRCLSNVGYFVIHTGPASKTYADGRNTHLIQEGKDWWVAVLKQFFVVGNVGQVGPELHIVVGNKMLAKQAGIENEE